MNNNRIQILPDALANQIAAGEVIERPASVIKELLENSIDAGATEIRIEIEAGGTGLIRVRDNGHGIHEEDMLLALQSHATSKIRQLSDLYQLYTLGFRGEALPSIAAVSRMVLTSRMESASRAWQMNYDSNSGGYVLSPATHPVGTTVEVRNLFYATPARRKFLRSERTEFLHILEIIRRLALSRSNLSIRLLHHGKQVFSCKGSPGNHGELIHAVMGKGFSQHARNFDYSNGEMRLWGWLGTSNLSRSQTDRQYFYFNGRIIRDKQINHAIRTAYEDTLPAGRFPTYVIYMEANPAAADVNVHPTKYEIRFRDSRDVHDFIFTHLKNTINDESRLFDDSEQVAGEPGWRGFPVTDVIPPYRSGARDSRRYHGFGFRSKDETVSAGPMPALGQPLMQFYGRFIISARNNSILLIDIHQAKRYMVRSKMLAATDNAPARHRPLLVPLFINVAPGAADLIDEHSTLISRYGLTLERQGPDSVIVRNIPALLPDVELQSLVQDLIDVMTHREPDHDILISVFVAHACDNYGSELNLDEVQKLLWALEETGIDTSNTGHTGIWKSLDIATLEILLAAK